MVALAPYDWLQLFLHYVVLSLLSIGGAITTAPEMHRYLVERHQWLTDAQFTSSIAVAQAAPGPNVLFVALLGWHVGLNAGGWPWAFVGMLTTLLGILLPSTTLTYVAARWGHRNQHRRGVRAFKQGLAPIVVGLLLATSWVLVAGEAAAATHHGPLMGLCIAAAGIMWRTRLHVLWLLAAGALLGWWGFV